MLSPLKLKRKKILDIIISIFLLSSLGLAAFIVSCSDQSNIISSFNTEQGSPYHQHVHGKRGVVTSAVTATFEAVGSGAAQEVGELGMGWALGAIGLTGASGPDWQAEFNTINNDLNTIINLLNESNEELASINAVLNEINCSQQSGSLQNAITAIEDDYAKYNTIIGTFTYEQDTAQFLSISTFLNQVFNGANGVMTLSAALSEIQANMTFPSGNVLTACMGTIPVPANGTFRGDSVYYVAAQSVLNYYYYYQTIGLGLLSEAYHYQGWLAAGAPGAGTKYSADSIQNIVMKKARNTIALL